MKAPGLVYAKSPTAEATPLPSRTESSTLIVSPGQSVDHAAPLKSLLQVLGDERAVATDHPAYHRRLVGPEPVARRDVRPAVDPPYRTEVVVHRPHGGGLHDRGDAFVERYESQNTKPPELVFRAFLDDGGARHVRFERSVLG